MEKIKNVIRNIAQKIIKTPYEKYILARVEGNSMNPLLKDGDDVPVKKMPLGTQYKEGCVTYETYDRIFTN